MFYHSTHIEGGGVGGGGGYSKTKYVHLKKKNRGQGGGYIESYLAASVGPAFSPYFVVHPCSHLCFITRLINQGFTYYPGSFERCRRGQAKQ